MPLPRDSSETDMSTPRFAKCAADSERENPIPFSLFWRFGVLAVSPIFPPGPVRDAEGWVLLGPWRVTINNLAPPNPLDHPERSLNLNRQDAKTPEEEEEERFGVRSWPRLAVIEMRGQPAFAVCNSRPTEVADRRSALIRNLRDAWRRPSLEFLG
jgi:hypothetical protein